MPSGTPDRSAPMPHSALGLNRSDDTVVPGDERMRLCRAFALAIQGPGPMPRVIDRHNQSPSATTIDSAVTSGTAFSVFVRKDIVVWDVDDDPGAELVALRLELEAGGFSPVQVASGRPNHRHVYVRCFDSDQADRVALLGERVLGLQPQSWIRPPLSPHRLGFPTRLERLTPAMALTSLNQPPRNGGVDTLARRPSGETPAAAQIDSSRPTRWGAAVLDRRCHHVEALKQGSRHSGLLRSARLVGGYVASGEINDEEATHRLIAAALAAGLPHREAVRVVNDGISHGMDNPLRSPSLQIIGGALGSMLSTPWPGKTGESDYRVMLAILELAWRASSDELAASTRTIALLAGKSRASVREALKRLEAAEWVKRCGQNDHGSSQWKILERPSGNDPVPPLPPAYDPELVLGPAAWAQPRLDMWRQGAMGGALLVHQRLTAWAMTHQELADSLGRSLPTVRRDVARLHTEDLVERTTDGRWKAVPPRDPDGVAHRWGTWGRAERQNLLNADEREAHRRRRDLDLEFFKRPCAPTIRLLPPQASRSASDPIGPQRTPVAMCIARLPAPGAVHGLVPRTSTAGSQGNNSPQMYASGQIDARRGRLTADTTLSTWPWPEPNTRRAPPLRPRSQGLQPPSSSVAWSPGAAAHEPVHIRSTFPRMVLRSSCAHLDTADQACAPFRDGLRNPFSP